MTLKELREKNKLSQAALAKSIGVSPSAVASIETGKLKPSQKIADAVKNVYGESIEVPAAKAKPAEKKAAKKAKPAAAGTKKAPAAKKASPLPPGRRKHLRRKRPLLKRKLLLKRKRRKRQRSSFSLLSAAKSPRRLSSKKSGLSTRSMSASIRTRPTGSGARNTAPSTSGKNCFIEKSCRDAQHPGGFSQADPSKKRGRAGKNVFKM